MIKLTFCLHRLPGLAREAFQEYWVNTHAPLVARQKHAPATPATGNAAQEPSAAPAPRPVPDRSAVDNPAGIRF